MGTVKDLSNMKFGKLSVLYQNGFAIDKKSGMRNAIWHCKCDCGKEIDVRGRNLTRGQTTSCGCLRKESHKGTRIRTKQFGCMECGSEKHYAKGLCKKCYEYHRLEKIRHKNELMNKGA